MATPLPRTTCERASDCVPALRVRWHCCLGFSPQNLPSLAAWSAGYDPHCWALYIPFAFGTWGGACETPAACIGARLVCSRLRPTGICAVGALPALLAVVSHGSPLSAARKRKKALSTALPVLAHRPEGTNA